MSKRQLALGNSAVMIDILGDLAEEIDEFLFSQHPYQNGAMPHKMLYLVANSAGRFTVRIDQQTYYSGSDMGDAAGALLGRALYHLTDQVSSGMVFHAGGVVCRGRGVMLPGTMGAGKTTLTAWLLQKGCAYVTDELVFIPDGGREMLGFRRPLNVKAPSLPIIDAFCPLTEGNTSPLYTSEGCLLPSTTLSTAVVPTAVSLSTVLFPHYDKESTGVVTPLSSAQTGLYLMRSLINARNLAHDGFKTAVSLASTVKAYALHYAHFEQIEPQLDKILNL